MSYLRYLCLFTYIVLCFCFRRLLYLLLPVSLDCPFFDYPFGIL